MKRMSNEELLLNIKAIINQLRKNVNINNSDCAVDVLQLAMVDTEIDERLKEENIMDPIILKACSKCNYQPCLAYGIDNQWYIKCYNCQSSTGLHANKRAAVIAWYNKNK